MVDLTEIIKQQNHTQGCFRTSGESLWRQDIVRRRQISVIAISLHLVFVTVTMTTFYHTHIAKFVNGAAYIYYE